jgi:hypothetical protein
MTQRFSIWLILLTLSICLTRGAAQAPNANNDGGLNVIVTVQGQASVKRQGWGSYAPVLFGTTVRRGDLLRLDGASQVKVVCAGLTVLDAPRGIGGVPCPASSRPLLRYQGSTVISTRAYGATAFPVILAPRKTKLLDPQPRLRWTAVNGASGYQVIVRGGSLNWGVEVRGKTELIYPRSAPPLLSGVDYKLIVLANNQRSDEEGAPGMGFALLSSNEAKEVRREEQRIRDMRLAELPTRFLIAHLYAGYGLHAEAIEQLEDLDKKMPEPASARLLGDLFQTIGLNRQAEQSYSTALELSRRAGDEEGQLLARQALAQIYGALNNKNLSAQHLKAALELARKLGDQTTAGKLEKRLAEFK